MCDEEYIIRKYFIVGVKEGKLVRKFQREVMPLSKFNPDFSSFCTERAKQDKLSNVVFVDKVINQLFGGGKINCSYSLGCPTACIDKWKF
jgi:hypothetical protein